jgi:MFS family permease
MPRRHPPIPLIYLTVVVSGASVMVLEILAPRLLGPVYGSGAQVWAAVISVTLAALAVGYWLGGQVADRWPRAMVFHAFVVLAAIAVVFVHGMAGALAEWCAGLGLRGGVIASTVLIFGPALMLLACVTPLACRVHPGHAERTGRTVGRLYAVSTAGSVAGALLAGFVLLPAWPISRSLLGTGLLLALIGVVGLAANWRKAAAAVVAVAAAVALAPSPEVPDLGVTVVRDQQTVHHRIQTLDTAEERLLLMDGALHTHISTVRTLDPVRCEYARAVELIPIVRPQARRFLLIGCGGGSRARAALSMWSTSTRR